MIEEIIVININRRKTTLRRLKPGMFVFFNDEIVKIIKLREQKITEKGVIYHFEVEGGNGSLIGDGGKKIFVKI